MSLHQQHAPLISSCTVVMCRVKGEQQPQPVLEENQKHNYYPTSLWGCHAPVTVMRWKQTVCVSRHTMFLCVCVCTPLLSSINGSHLSHRKCESVCLLFSQMELWHCLDNWDKWLAVQLSRWEKQQPVTHKCAHTNIKTACTCEFLCIHSYTCAWLYMCTQSNMRTQLINKSDLLILLGIN